MCKMTTPLHKWLTERPLSKRLKDAQTVRDKYPDRLPIVVFPANDHTPCISAHKFLVPEDLTVAQFIHLLRLRITLKPEQAIFIFATTSATSTSTNTNTHDVLVNSTDLIKLVYHRYKSDVDSFLYLVYDIENTFG